MMRFMFESDIPTFSNLSALELRANNWKRGGIDTVVLQVDDGHGATWPSAVCPVDPRISLAQEPLKNAVKYLHDNGFRVVLCVNICGIVRPDLPPIKPEFYLTSSVPHYNAWSVEFQDWRAAYIAECCNYVDADMVFLDYLRTNREKISEPITAQAAMLQLLTKLRAAVDTCYPIISCNHSSFARVPAQGIDVNGWLTAGLTDYACLFNYTSPFPTADLASVQENKLIPLTGNYDSTSNGVVTRSGAAVAKEWRRLQHGRSLAGLGLYLAGLFNADQADSLKYVPMGSL